MFGLPAVRGLVRDTSFGDVMRLLKEQEKLMHEDSL